MMASRRMSAVHSAAATLGSTRRAGSSSTQGDRPPPRLLYIITNEYGFLPDAGRCLGHTGRIPMNLHI